MSIQQLRDARAAKVKEAKNLLEQNTGDKWTPEVSAQVDGLYAEIDRYEEQIDRHDKMLKLEASNKERIVKRAGMEDISELQAEANIEMEKEIFNSWLRHGEKGLKAEHQEYVQKRIQAAQSVGTDSEGGYLVPNDFSGQLLERLKAYGGMREVATIIQTDSGNQIDFPTVDETAEEGELVAENTDATDGDAAFGTTNITAYKYSSKVVAVPIELLQDNRVNLEDYILGALARRIQRITNKHYTIGTGSGQPQGVATASGLGKTGASGQTTSVIWEDLVDLEHALDPAYRQNPAVRFMFNDSTLKVLKKLKDADDRPLYVPGLDKKDPATINGYAYVINQNVASMAASAKSILFGDFSKFLIRDVMQITLQRFTDSAYAKKGQVGFLAWYRGDGKIIAATAADVVKHYANAAS